jgi:protein-tyrosine phosphatase
MLFGLAGLSSFIGKFLIGSRVRILVSYAGVSRSAACVMAYLMQEHDMGMFQALQLCKQKRSVVFPNPGF